MTIAFKCLMTPRHPLRIERLPLIGRLQRAASRPRRRAAKRLIGKPARFLYRFARSIGLSGHGTIMLRIGDREVPLAFDARNTQFVTPADQMEFEPELAAMIDLLLDNDGVLFDIGANWGYVGLYALSRPGFGGVVHAFEPYPSSFADLESIRRQTPSGERISCHQVALSDRDGTASMGLVDGVHSGLARLGGAADSRAVDVRRLDGLGLPAPTVMKVDVEGHEANVLSGAADCIRAARPAIIFESWKESARPEVTLAPFARLSDMNYRVFVPCWVRDGDGYETAIAATNRTPTATSQFGLVEIAAEHRFMLPDQLNLLAWPAEKMDALAARFHGRR